MNETIQAALSIETMKLVVLIFVFALIFIGFMLIFLPSRSKRYREILSDLYVSGKIRQFADKDKIDLDAENQKFKKWDKKESMKYEGLANTIEEELKDKVMESNLEGKAKK